MFEVKDKVIVITGGTGVLGSSIAKSLICAGAKVVIIGRNPDKLNSITKSLENKENLIGFCCDVLDEGKLCEVRDQILKKWDSIHVLINVAGGNMPRANVNDEQTVFDVNIDEHKKVIGLNLDGTIIPSIIFGKVIAESGDGSIINISSMATYSAITRVMGYSVAKTGVNNFTQWMAMEMALKFGDRVRVNAIAPGFFIGEQNRNVLINPDGSYTERSKKVLARTPMKRFGNINELNGAVQFLCSDAASFITGVILPVDGGFSSFSGV
ncbi:SDR family oxidoreductase [Galbibacter sp. EGI 63066]|uniref:SDR family oxidoreductase n=1 Tax=Galbibacter sp. EGI 63066 TaxID=2993559 RepID=UPI0022489AD7|nr:SDR family oxidoreductase [Galbibacter sp. EGI 63066]MCX2678653.1 SDR family oxidoreductase [Galbibacter sp. EGI 63066]